MSCFYLVLSFVACFQPYPSLKKSTQNEVVRAVSWISGGKCRRNNPNKKITDGSGLADEKRFQK
jgi:hypothetical protein